MLLNEQLSSINEKQRELENLVNELANKLNDENLNTLLNEKIQNASEANLNALSAENERILNENVKNLENTSQILLKNTLNETKTNLENEIKGEFQSSLKELKSSNSKNLALRLADAGAEINEAQNAALQSLNERLIELQDKLNELKIQANINKNDLIDEYFKRYKSDFEASFNLSFLKNDLLRSSVFKEQTKEIIATKVQNHLENDTQLQDIIRGQVAKVKLDFNQKQEFLRFELGINFLATALYAELETLSRGLSLIYKMDKAENLDPIYNKYAII